MTRRVDVCSKQLIKCAAAKQCTTSETTHGALFISTCQDFVEQPGQTDVIPQLLFVLNQCFLFFSLYTFSYLQLPVTNMSGFGPGDRRNGADPGEE